MGIMAPFAVKRVLFLVGVMLAGGAFWAVIILLNGPRWRGGQNDGDG